MKVKHLFLQRKICLVLLLLLGLACESFALRVHERNRPGKKDPAIIDREVYVTSVNGVDHGFAVRYRQKGGSAQAVNTLGFDIGYLPTGNWYQGGFLRNITVNGKQIKLQKSKYPEVIRVLSNTPERTVLGVVFETEAGELQLTMVLQKGKYYSYVKIEFINPVKPIKTLEFNLLNHPGHYDKKKLARVIRTSSKTFEMKNTFAVDHKDDKGWAFFEDKNGGAFGPSAFMYLPEQIDKVTYSVYMSYLLTTKVKLKPGNNTAHFLFWHFPAKQFPQNMALDYMKSKTGELSADLRKLSSEQLKGGTKNSGNDISFYEMKKLAKPPVIDGKSNDAVWQNVPWTGSFYYLGTPDKAQPETNFKLAYDNSYFYFLVECKEPDIRSVRAKVPQNAKWDSNTWEDDYVEMYICPYGELDKYFQFIINSNGAIWDSKVDKAKRERSWNSNIEVKALTGKDVWYVEGRIPVKDLVKADKKTTSLWLFNMTRQRLASETGRNAALKWSSWSKLPIANTNTTSAFNVLSDFDAPFAKRPEAFMAADNYKDLFLQKFPIRCTFPREELFITNNMYAPNFVKIKDQRWQYKNYLAGSGKYRKREDWKQYLDSLKIHVRLPDGCTLLTGETGFRSIFSVKQVGKNHYVLSPLRKDSDNKWHKITHCYFDYAALYMKSTLPAGSKGVMEIWVEQEINKEKLVTGVTKYPFTVIEFPEVKQLKQFVINVWPDVFSLFIPDYVRKTKALGFNSIPLRWDWVEYNHKRYPGAKSKALENHIRSLAKEAKANGMMVVIHDSTMGEFYSSKQGRWGNTKFMDPGFTGPIYQKEIKDVKEIAEELEPDHLFIDCEYFAHHGKFGEKEIYSWAPGKERIQKSGLSLKGYLSSCGDRLAGDVRKALYLPGKPRIKVGFYGTGGCFYLPHVRFPGREMFDLIFNIHTLLKKDLVDYAMPSPYHSGEIDDRYILCFSELRKNIGNQPILPWAAAGYPVPFSKEMVRDQFLETCAFGCVGIAYFDESSWDVGAYLYQAKAINEIAPFEDIVMDGKFYEQQNKEYKSAHIKGMIKDSEAIILFSCYKRFKDITETVQNPLPVDCEVYDASTGKKLGKVRKGGSIKVTLDMKRNTKLLYFGNSWKARTK